MRNLESRDPGEGDKIYEMFIRRKNLDAIPGKAKSTIDVDKRKLLITVKNCEKIRKTPSYAPRGTLPLGGPCGMGLSVEILVKSIIAKEHI